MTLQQARAPVPAKNSIIVVRGTNDLGLGEAAHCVRKERGESMWRASYAHLRFCSPFMQESGGIKALVAPGEAPKKPVPLPMATWPVSPELVGNFPAEQAEARPGFGL